MFNFIRRKKAEEQNVAEKLYAQNLELAVKNKTLSLLERLYQTSILNLTPEEVARQITEIIRQDLNLELAGLLIFEREQDNLRPINFSKSERLIRTLYRLGFLFKDIIIPNISKHPFLNKVVYEQKDIVTHNLQDIWKESITPEDLKELEKESHIKAVLAYPLIIDREIFGILLLGLNRDYGTLNTFEKASIKSFINIIALLLDKAYLYKNLQESYEVTKKAYAVEKQAKEELEKLDKVKNQFLMQTQHDLRTPLGIIRDYCDLLLTGTLGKLPKKSLDSIKRIQIVAQNKIKDVNNFLDTTQFQLGKKVVSLTEGVELNPIINEIMDELKPQAQAKNISLTLNKPESDIKVQADREKLKAAIFNIVDNCIKYTTKGGVTVNVAMDSGLKITITDTGIGVPKEKLATLFDSAFERSDDAKKVSPSGKGIGLYLSGQIIKAHNGKVWVESEGAGKGSVFHVELPLN